MHILLGAATELAECSSPEQRKNLYDRIYTSVSGLDHLLANLLDAAQIEAGRLLTVAPVFTDVRHLTEEVTQLYEFESVRKGLDLKYIFAPIDACWTMPVDPLRFKQILMNLIGNALKYTENGGIFS